MSIRIVDYLLAVAGLGGHVFLLILLFRRRLVARLPLFAILIAFYVFRSTASFFLKPASATLGWTLAGIDPLLQCGLFAWIVLTGSPLAGRRRTPAALILLVGAFALAASLSWYIGPSSHFSLQNLLLKSGILVAVLWLEAALATFASSRIPSVGLASPIREIVRGFALYSAANLLADVGRHHLQAIGGMTFYLGISYLPIAAYLLSLWIWIGACASSAPVLPDKLTPGPISVPPGADDLQGSMHPYLP